VILTEHLPRRGHSRQAAVALEHAAISQMQPAARVQCAQRGPRQGPEESKGCKRLDLRCRGFTSLELSREMIEQDV
jgi:hypothetical protein